MRTCGSWSPEGETFIVSQGLDVGRGGAAWGAQIMGPETKVAIPAHDARVYRVH